MLSLKKKQTTKNPTTNKTANATTKKPKHGKKPKQNPFCFEKPFVCVNVLKLALFFTLADFCLFVFLPF